MSSENNIQLPSSASSQGQKDTVTCPLCRRQFAKYTCPTCNVPYCSLTCFRSPAHNQCSEGFYKKEIEADIHSGPSKTAQERQKMMELLKKFEDDSSAEQSLVDGDDDDEDEDESDLVRRFETVDLDSLSPDALWSMLTPEERKKFTKAFDDPTSELAQQLLSSEQLEKEIQEPWWEAPTVDDSETIDDIVRRHGTRPDLMSIPTSMVKPIPTGHPLVYNMCAICIAYAYITRHLGTSPLGNLKPQDSEYQEARRLVTQLVPFLTDRRSTELYPNLPAVVTSIWSLLDLGEMTSSLFSVLLRDSAQLIKPLRITPVAPSSNETDGMLSSSHPHSMPVLVLSDIDKLLMDKFHIKDGQESQTNSKPNHITHKLRFYAAHILSTPSSILGSLSDEMMARAKGYEGEVGKVASDTSRGESRRL
ncbi:hypothetical protein GALMADRAFT_222197 [Galerina marginata CBS 339.88]|uniref:HIT-type domain-containing protein n=1 Tax=Galerina marginata (strain CBS 339.88) TaxID=685588 RepID=A0A067TNQ7_GALM3|nr:hypothetical protein GALMADRAFT_222197 [Galerina marginata CBS 339.88]